jgi:hypothetical protein
MRSRIILCGIVVAALALGDTAGGLSWTTPSTWKRAGPKPMRVATYTVPPTAGDKEGGECAVNYFGQGQGGGIQANVDRWIGQFQQPTAKHSGKKTIHGLNVTTVDVIGTYMGMGGPMAATHTPKNGYRLLGAIVEGPEGTVFFKFTGPLKTVVANQATFDKMLDTLKK